MASYTGTGPLVLFLMTVIMLFILQDNNVLACNQSKTHQGKTKEIRRCIMGGCNADFPFEVSKKNQRCETGETCCSLCAKDAPPDAAIDNTNACVKAFSYPASVEKPPGSTADTMFMTRLCQSECVDDFFPFSAGKRLDRACNRDPQYKSMGRKKCCSNC